MKQKQVYGNPWIKDLMWKIWLVSEIFFRSKLFTRSSSHSHLKGIFFLQTQFTQDHNSQNWSGRSTQMSWTKWRTLEKVCGRWISLVWIIFVRWKCHSILERTRNSIDFQSGSFFFYKTGQRRSVVFQKGVCHLSIEKMTLLFRPTRHESNVVCKFGFATDLLWRNWSDS